MSEPPPTSVLLPTVDSTPVLRELAEQLRRDDELLVLCDDPDDPVGDDVEAVAASAAVDGDVRTIAGGEPTGCSGKANAVAAGMEAARNDRLAWTDDDFHHPPDWLATMQADYERHGPVTELPHFVGRDPLSYLLEPLYVAGASAGVCLTNQAWGGAVLFERSDLDVEALCADLRRSVSDDGLLSEYLDVTAVRRTRSVGVGGSIRDTLERQVRFTHMTRRHFPATTIGSTLLGGLVAAGSLAVVLPALLATTLLFGCLYAAFGVRRWTAVLAYPALLAWPVLATYSLARRTFVWGGRRYRWVDKFDVRVRPASGD